MQLQRPHNIKEDTGKHARSAAWSERAEDSMASLGLPLQRVSSLALGPAGTKERGQGPAHALTGRARYMLGEAQAWVFQPHRSHRVQGRVPGPAGWLHFTMHPSHGFSSLSQRPREGALVNPEETNG